MKFNRLKKPKLSQIQPQLAYNSMWFDKLFKVFTFLQALYEND